MSAILEATVAAAFREGAVRAIRTRAAAQKSNAERWSADAGGEYPGVAIRQGEGAVAHRLAVALAAIADDIEAGRFA